MEKTARRKEEGGKNGDGELMDSLLNTFFNDFLNSILIILINSRTRVLGRGGKAGRERIRSVGWTILIIRHVIEMFEYDKYNASMTVYTV